MDDKFGYYSWKFFKIIAALFVGSIVGGVSFLVLGTLFSMVTDGILLDVIAVVSYIVGFIGGVAFTVVMMDVLSKIYEAIVVKIEVDIEDEV